MVQGTLGYLDPEYFHTNQLMDKSDVYYFGVLLADLFTGRMTLEFHRPENGRNLANYFLSSMKLEYLFIIQDDTFTRNKEAWNLNGPLQLQQVAELTKRCLRVEREKRPTMNEVVMILDGLRMSSSNSWVCGTAMDDDKLGKVHFLDGQLSSANYTDYSTGGDYDSMKNKELSSLSFGDTEKKVDKSRVTVSLDISNEIFKEMELPKEMNIFNTHVAVLEGCLCLFGSLWNVGRSVIEIWVMQSYGERESWTKRHTVKVEIFDNYLRLIMSFKSGEILFGRDITTGLVIHDPDQYGSVIEPINPRFRHLHLGELYFGSLVSL
ncbi:wall-associated receptor kinase 3-like [Papaver somniferum]|uniref:wall-associated receptor kinase 3-like n=1 Tax=Papaver somniferum TaxID=3469 RepID=UPI000E705DCB|nr:wall-associated receptor kinase 3-like [Papaver somniferum]